MWVILPHEVKLQSVLWAQLRVSVDIKINLLLWSFFFFFFHWFPPKRPCWCVLLGSPPSPLPPGQMPRTQSVLCCFCLETSPSTFVNVAQWKKNPSGKIESYVQVSENTVQVFCSLVFRMFVSIISTLAGSLESVGSVAAEVLPQSVSFSNLNKALCRE